MTSFNYLSQERVESGRNVILFLYVGMNPSNYVSTVAK